MTKCLSIMCGSRGRGRTPWEITNIWSSLAILVSQSYQSSIQCWAIIGPVAKRHLNGVSLAGRWWPAHSVICILPSSPHQKKKRCRSWAPSDKTFWIRAWSIFNDLEWPSTEERSFFVLFYTGGKPRNYHEIVLTQICSQATSGTRRGSFQAENWIKKGWCHVHFCFILQLRTNNGEIRQCSSV